jgi:hypothetical protein
MGDALKDLLKRFSTLFNGLKIKIFGQNNERLDFVLDSFYKLSPAQRNGVLSLGIGALVLVVIAAISLYFAQVGAVENELSDGFSSLRELKKYKIEYQMQDKRFNKLVDNIKRKTKDVSFKPFFEKLSREKNVQIKDISEKTSEMDSSNALSDKVKEARVEMRLPNISIPRLLDFLIEIEKSGHYLRIEDIKISATYGNKFFFDTTLVIRGYNVI